MGKKISEFKSSISNHMSNHSNPSCLRTAFTASTIAVSAASVSGQSRVLSPQSGFAKSRVAGMYLSISNSLPFNSSIDGTRGEWMS